MSIDKHLQPQVKAYRLAIESLEEIRRKKFNAAHVAYQQGLRADEIQDDDGVTGLGFAWVEEGEAKYQEYTKAISEMHDLLEMMEDAEVTTTFQPGLFAENES